ncbi:tail fiber protein [Endozoicomonas sp. 4G]|uniref:tail fiber protein n=1 Tax=Endozoicomonas sp. 4G TaxID=2872754 RepID=UPI002078AA5B|nr:tail fiber protein [Endozoicomonas sp. 4G]
MPFKISNLENIGLPLIITDAGREAAIAADDAGLKLNLIEIAIGDGLWQPEGDATSLQNEIKRIDNLGGSDLSDDVIHLTVTDDSTDEYQLGEFGLYSDNGVLCAIYSQQKEYISEKIAESILMISADMKLDTVPPGSVTITGNNFQYPPATPDSLGVIKDAPDDDAPYIRQSMKWLPLAPFVFTTGMTMPWPCLIEKIPAGWMHINGQILNIDDQPALFEMMGNVWGGDGVSTFALPPADIFLLMAGSVFSIGDIGGAPTATSSENGSHSHSVTIDSAGDHSHSVTVDSAGDHSHTVTVNATTLTTDQMTSHQHYTGETHQTGGDLTGGLLYQSMIAVGDQQHEVTDRLNEATGGSGSHSHTASTGSTGSHSHNADTDNTGSHTHNTSTASTGSHTHTVDTVPPYAAMAYIIKL